jgi:hypothetical protein
MNIKDMIEVMKAYENRKNIQCRYKDEGRWCDLGTPSWDWSSYDYRIKQPEDKYRPYKPEELILLKGKWLKTKEGSIAQVIGIALTSNLVLIFTGWYSPTDLLKDWTFEDGSPCGVKIEG